MTNETAPGQSLSETDLRASLVALGLLGPREDMRLVSLAGGVSSDILFVETASRRFCVKRALPRLKVKALWEAPIERNQAEAAYLRQVEAWLPGAVPALLGEDRARGLFVMDYLPPATHPVWKSLLLEGIVDPNVAVAVGRQLGAIHARSAGDEALASLFAHDATFERIRIEPYLRATGRVHADLAPRLDALAEATLATRSALVHGDVSPKNILCGPEGPVFLDAECAWYGDPAFDVAFCLSHLLLKALVRPEALDSLLACSSALFEAYTGVFRQEPPAAIEGRIAGLLPALLLARIDGKSPVDYLDEPQQHSVRAVARSLLHGEVSALPVIFDAWRRHHA